MTKTGQDFKDQVEKLGLNRWELRQCSICDAPLYYIFRGGKIFFDSNCDCVRDRSRPDEVSWNELARHYNRAASDEKYVEYKKELDKFWQFSNGTT